jgi:RNA polymerase sigma-70 factor (sigma-E family)
MMRKLDAGGTAVTESIQRGRGSGRLAELYELHSPEAIRLAYLLTGDVELAQDLVQEAFVKLVGHFTDLIRAQSFDAYLKRTIVNLAYGHFRRRRVERAYSARVQTLTRTSTEFPDVEERDELWNRLHLIAPRQRAALVLRYYDDLSEQQTADVLGCSVRTVKSLVARGLHAMRLQGGQRD